MKDRFPLKVWLSKIGRDQNIEDLNDIETPLARLLRYFKRRDIGHTVTLGYYDVETEKIKLGTPSPMEGDARRVDTLNIVSAVSQAATTIINVPAGYMYFVRAVMYKNSTRGPTITSDLTRGGVAVQIVDTAANAMGSGVTHYLIGGSTENGVTGQNPKLKGGFWMSPGETVVVTCGNFVAADVTEVGAVVDRWAIT